ncbi:hypothetical protein [Streptomyces scopuliridis]|uniref:hypothetical protein n=1 Tax=Streptomyces scopuliridis TaxID=452529 RepID=UPI0036D1DD15
MNDKNAENTVGESVPTGLPEPVRLLSEASSTAQAVTDLTDALHRVRAVRERDPDRRIVCRIELDLSGLS